MVRNNVAACAIAVALFGVSLYAYADRAGASSARHYRRWTVVKGRLVGPSNPGAPNNAGFRYIYANRVARDGYERRSFEEGSVLIDERVQATEDANGIYQEGATLHVGVMVKDSRRCADTGGWCFNFFVGDDTSVGIPAAAQKACFTRCHSSQVDTDSVFSRFRKP
jgi:hypothetical protein